MVAPARAPPLSAARYGGIAMRRRAPPVSPQRASSVPPRILAPAVPRTFRARGVPPAALSARGEERRLHAARGGARGACGGTRCSAGVPDYLPASWKRGTDEKPLGPRLELSAEEAVQQQLWALQCNDHPYPDHGVEVMYRFERFRRLFHHSHYRVLLSHKRHHLLSSFYVSPVRMKQRVQVEGLRPGELETFEFTLEQVGCSARAAAGTGTGSRRAWCTTGRDSPGVLRTRARTMLAARIGAGWQGVGAALCWFCCEKA
ncbi:hypothetical protein CLOP_g19497 [Closterium sp. NIES-67]|nr:hypothetical protein CLOP_g19497 [Closterium sp. NIES-67]